MKIILFIAAVFLISCGGNNKNSGDDKKNTPFDTGHGLIDTESKGIVKVNSKIDSLLAKPFDLQKFKRIKRSSHSGGSNDRATYYYKPDYKGTYFGFFMFSWVGYSGTNKSDTVEMENGLTIITYQPIGKGFDRYINPREELIEVTALFNDFDLPELAFVGLDTIEIKNKLGGNFFRKDSCFIYSKDKNALILKILGKKVEWLKYTRLNLTLTKDTIPPELLKN